MSYIGELEQQYEDRELDDNHDACADEIGKLRRLLQDARPYVADFYPARFEDGESRDKLIAEIDKALPKASEQPAFAPAPQCSKTETCCMGDGHSGACDDLPY